MTTLSESGPRSLSFAVIDAIHVTVVVAAGLLIALLATGTPTLLSIQVTLYSMALFAGAGYGFSGLPALGQRYIHYRAMLSLVIGICIAPTITYATYAAGYLHLTNYVVVGVLVSTTLWLRPDRVDHEPLDLSRLYVPVIIATILAPLGVLAVTDAMGATDHGSMQVIVAEALRNPWPPESPFTSGVPIAYHYGLHLLLDLVSMSTGASLDTLADTVAPTLFLWFCIWGITVLAAHWFRLSALACIALALVLFAVFGHVRPFALLSVLRTIPFTGVLTLSPLLGHLILVLGLFVFVRAADSADGRSKVATVLLLAMVAFSASIVRAGASGILLACTTSTLWLCWVIMQRRIQIWPTLLTFVVGIASIAGVFMTLGVPGQFSGTNFLTFGVVEGVSFIGSYVHLIYREIASALGWSYFLTGLIGLAVYVALAAGPLSPAMWAFIGNWRHVGPGSSAIALLLAFGIATAFTFVTVAPGASHVVIGQTGYCCSAILGAIGLDHWWRNRERGCGSWAPPPATALAIFFTIALGAIHLATAVQRIAEVEVIDRIFVPRDPALRAHLGEDMNLSPILNQINNPSTAYFLLPKSATFDVRTTYNLMAKYDLKLLAYEFFLGLSSAYGGNERDKLNDLREAMSAFAQQTSFGIVDLKLAEAVIQASLNSTARTIVIAPRSMELVRDPAFSLAAQSETFDAWAYLPNESD